jgi:1-acyl-sn-glycerol-3-phosphate acyltransferase
MQSSFVQILHHPRLERFLEYSLRFLCHYFRLEIQGLEYIPRRGGAMLVANHSGVSGLDAVLLAHLIRWQTGRKVMILAHRAFFDFSPSVKNLAESFLLRKACFENGVKILEEGNICLIFPEGEDGNFKPSTERYQLRAFHTGFLRMAAAAKVPVLMASIIGAEGTHWNLAQIKLHRWVRGLSVPVPVNLIPLPSKWRIRIDPAFSGETMSHLDPNERQVLQARAAGLRVKLQRQIDEERQKVRFGLMA